MRRERVILDAKGVIDRMGGGVMVVRGFGCSEVRLELERL